MAESNPSPGWFFSPPPDPGTGGGDPADSQWLQRFETLRRVVQCAWDFAIITMDPARMITGWSEGASRIFGYHERDVLGLPADVIFVPEDRAVGKPEQEARTAEREGRAEDERWHLRADGTRFFASGSLTPLRDANGVLFGFTKILRDVTSRKHAEDELVRLAEQQRLALDAAELGWWRLDPGSGVIEWDERTRAIYGLEQESIGVDEVLERIHPSDRSRLHEMLHGLEQSRDSERRAETYRVVRPDGAIRTVESLAQPWFEEQGAVRRRVGLVGTVADVTERRRAEDALRTRESALHQLADTLPQIVWGARPDGTVDYYNRRWYEYTGLAPGPASDENWERVTPDAERVRREWSECVRTGRPYELEYRLRRGSDGMERWHLGRAVPVRNAEGEIERWVGTNRDIHDRKLLESANAALLKAEREALQEAVDARNSAEEASRMKDEFLATVSHELRTPLNAIVGWATLLQDPPLDEGSLAEGIEAIRRNAEAQARLIEDILDIARITSGKMRLQSLAVDLPQVLAAAVETVHAGARAKSIELRVETQRGLPPILGDADRLQQVFWNLLSNAVKFTPEGGRVTVRARREHDHVVVRVIDSGMGIDPALLPRVFEKFLQGDARANRRQGGLGLGLAIVRHLVELHGGAVGVQSGGKGAGSTFVVELPAGVAPRPTHHTAEAPVGPRSGELAGRRVLVVDDDPDTRRVVQAVLSRAGAEVTLVSSAADALGVLTSDHGFDAVLSDIGMPGEDGYVFARRMRAMEQARDLPKLPLAAVTAYTREQDRTHALNVGFDAFVSKPIRPTELVEIVSVMAHSRPSSPSSGP